MVDSLDVDGVGGGKVLVAIYLLPRYSGVESLGDESSELIGWGTEAICFVSSLMHVFVIRRRGTRRGSLRPELPSRTVTPLVTIFGL